MLWPTSIDQVKELASVTRMLYSENPIGFIATFSAVYLLKQTFAIPGSFFLNVLAGAAIGNPVCIPLVAILASTGATFCFLLSRLFFSSALTSKPSVSFLPSKPSVSFLPSSLASVSRKILSSDKLKTLEQSLKSDSQNRFWLLVSLRIFPFTPNWLLNFAAPLLGVNLYVFFWSMMLGSLPYIVVCTQGGVVLSQITEMTDILTPSVVIKLVLLSLLAIAPSLYTRTNKSA